MPHRRRPALPHEIAAPCYTDSRPTPATATHHRSAAIAAAASLSTRVPGSRAVRNDQKVPHRSRAAIRDLAPQWQPRPGKTPAHRILLRCDAPARDAKPLMSSFRHPGAAIAHHLSTVVIPAPIASTSEHIGNRPGPSQASGSLAGSPPASLSTRVPGSRAVRNDQKVPHRSRAAIRDLAPQWQPRPGKTPAHRILLRCDAPARDAKQFRLHSRPGSTRTTPPSSSSRRRARTTCVIGNRPGPRHSSACTTPQIGATSAPLHFPKSAPPCVSAPRFPASTSWPAVPTARSTSA